MPTATDTVNLSTAPLTLLSDEEKMFQNTVRRFARERIGPHVREMDEAGAFRKELLQEMFELGLMGIEIPEEYGGQGGNFFQSVLAVEALAAVDPSAAVIVDVQNTIANNILIRWGTNEQKRRYLAKLARDTVCAFALSEAGSGSDAFGMASRAVKKGDHFLITGRKLWITNAAEAGIYFLFANANPEAGHRGITCFIVERGFAGFQVGKKEDKLGIRASSTCELILDECRVPVENVLGENGKGYKIAIETLNEGRIAIGAQMTGLAQGALDHALGADTAPPSQAQIDDIIQKFAAKEADFARERENYTYRQTARVLDLDEGGNTVGRWEEVSDIIFNADGKRNEHVVRAPVS